MPAMTTKQILDRVRSLHQHLADDYEALGSRAERPACGQLFEHQAWRERRLASALEAYESSASPVVLDTWFQFAPEFAEKLEHVGGEIEPGASAHEVLDLLLENTNRLLSFLQAMVKLAPVPEVKEAFANLARQLERDERKTTRAGNEAIEGQ